MARRTSFISPLGLAGMIFALGLSVPAMAHDLWIEPSTFHPEVGELVWVGLRIGHPPTGGEPVRRDERRLERFVLRGPQGETPIPGLDGREPAGWIRPPAPGRYVVALRSHAAVSVLPAEVFERYLEEKGLQAVSAERARRGDSGEPGRERYSRALKALLTVDGLRQVPAERLQDAAGLGADRPLGLRLELIARADPSTLRAGDSLPVELRFENRPLAGVRVEAHPLLSAAEASTPALAVSTPTVSAPLVARTDARGRVRFTLPQEGPWLLTAVHMIPASSGVEEDWESVWTALSFSVGRD